jgi:hypothetical protein
MVEDKTAGFNNTGGYGERGLDLRLAMAMDALTDFECQNAPS